MILKIVRFFAFLALIVLISVVFLNSTDINQFMTSTPSVKVRRNYFIWFCLCLFDFNNAHCMMHLSISTPSPLWGIEVTWLFDQKKSDSGMRLLIFYINFQ